MVPDILLMDILDRCPWTSDIRDKRREGRRERVDESSRRERRDEVDPHSIDSFYAYCHCELDVS